MTNLARSAVRLRLQRYSGWGEPSEVDERILSNRSSDYGNARIYGEMPLIGVEKTVAPW